MNEHTIEIKFKPNLKGIDWAYDGEFDIGDAMIDQETGELIVDIIPLETE